MATLNTTNAVGTQNVATNGARQRRKVAQYATGGTQGNGDILNFFSVRSGDIIDSLLLSCDALSGMTDVNFGLRLPDGTDVDENLFDDAQTLATALTRQEKRVKTAAGANSALGVETLSKTVWELLGLTSDPFLTYHVTADIIAAGSASGDIIVEMVYTAGD
jgi:hypothetical protein